MTDILCNWLNHEVKISKKVDATNFAREFANGYLIGEVLEKYQLQDDLDQFSLNTTADSKLNNFTRLETTFHLLEIPFDTNIARDVMTEKYGVATRLMYQLFIALNRKAKNNLTGVAMETMRPAAPVKLEGVESDIYKERLKHMTPRQTDLNLDALVARFHQKQIQMEQTAFKERFEEEESHNMMLQQQREDLIRKYNENKVKKSDMLAKINDRSPSDSPVTSSDSRIKRGSSAPSPTSQGHTQTLSRAATVHIPKPPPNRSAKAVQMRREAVQMRETAAMQRDIDSFETKMKRTLPPSKPLGESMDVSDVAALPDNLELIMPGNNDEYIGKIRKRLSEDASAREEREKRRRKVLVDQMKAHEAQEEARREEMLVNRLMRQSQQERRIAVQLLQARHEKEVIRRNRLLREKQYEDRRLREFEDALNKEAEMARLAKLEYIEQAKKDKELHDKIAAERAESRYRKHYDMCLDVLLNIVDFSTKTGEYRELTNRLLPARLVREWTALFVDGKPLYGEPPEPVMSSDEPTPEQILEEERQQLLDEGDFNEYRNMMGEWQPPEGSDLSRPCKTNPIVGHIVHRLFSIVHPPSPPPPPPEFPPFPIKACVLGKVFAGKTTTIKRLVENHRLHLLNADHLVAEALEANRVGEQKPEIEELAATSSYQLERVGSSATDVGGGKSEAEVSVTQSRSGSSAVPDNKDTEEVGPTTSLNTLKPDDGKEKGDAEKPVENEAIPPDVWVTKSSNTLPASNSKSSAASQRSLQSARAKLGAKVNKLLKKGKPVDDPLIVEIIIEAVKRIPEGTGWVLDGFPNTYAQAKLLEKALTGIDDTGKEKSKAKTKKSQLAPDPKPQPPPPEPASGINVIILFDIPNEVCLRRSAGRTKAPQTNEEFQQEFKPPPEGSATGIQNQEKVVQVIDEAHDMEQIQTRLTTFQDNWPKLEKWFTKFGTLQMVNADQAEESMYLEAEKILEDTINKLQGKDIEGTDILELTETKEEEKTETEKKPEEPKVEETVKEEDRLSRTDSKKGSRAGSAKRSSSRSSKEGKRDKSKSPGRSPTKEGKKSGSGKGSRPASGKSPKRGKSGKKSKTPEPEPEVEPEVPPGTPPPQPGSDQWEYVEEPLDDELAHILCPQWETLENTYIDSSKTVFRNIRNEREIIIRYFYQIRKNFQEYLRRPDLKQELVAQWQKAYNDVSDDIREDEETCSELHQRVDDLRERLWTICDDRKEQAEKEQTGVMNEGWLEDHLGLLANHYITLMQAEVDRYQETVRLLKDYYKGMEGKIPEEIMQDYARIPLIELPVAERTVTPSKSAMSEAHGSRTGTPNNEETKSSPSKSGTPSAKRKTKEDSPAAADQSNMDVAAEEKRARIPLVPRRPQSPDAAGQAKGKGDKGKGKDKGGKDGAESPQPPSDSDDRLVFDAYVTGLHAIEKIIAAEQAAREAEEEAERMAALEREREKEKAMAAKKGGKGGKKGKSRSPSPKKGGKEKDSPSQATPPPKEETEEEKERKKVKEKAKVEFFAAIEQEATAARSRMDLIKAIAFSVNQDLKGKADDAYKDMNDWLGARFLKEMGSIDQLSEVMRHAIEDGRRIQEELVIDQDHFLVSEDVKVLRTPTPEPRPPPIEAAHADTFTVHQILNIYSQFALTAPSGIFSAKGFQETFSDMASLAYGTEHMPDLWTTISQDKLEAMALALSPDGEYVDWRTFLLAAAKPWPTPSQQDLLDALQQFRDMDQQGLNYVSREQYDRVLLWFGEPVKALTPADPTEPYPYDRLTNLKSAIFDLFADINTNPPQLDYINMLLYFSVSPEPYEGFLRALSVASGTHMPRLPKKNGNKKRPVSSRPASQASLAASVDLDTEKAEEQMAPENIPEAAMDATVPLDALDKVLHHGQSMRGDSHRFSVTADPEDAFSMERMAGVYQDLGCEATDRVLFTTLIEHPIIQDIVANLNSFKSANLKLILTNPVGEAAETHSVKTSQ